MKHVARLGSALLALLPSALGCVSTSFSASKAPDGTAFAKVAPESVKVFTAAPTVAYRTVGEIEADISGFPSDEAVLRRVREKAASVGANAIIYVYAGWSYMANSFMLTDIARPTTYTFTAIRVPDDPTPQSP
jgi:hypothetical protein